MDRACSSPINKRNLDHLSMGNSYDPRRHSFASTARSTTLAHRRTSFLSLSHVWVIALANDTSRLLRSLESYSMPITPRRIELEAIQSPITSAKRDWLLGVFPRRTQEHCTVRKHYQQLLTSHYGGLFCRENGLNRIGLDPVFCQAIFCEKSVSPPATLHHPPQLSKTLIFCFCI